MCTYFRFRIYAHMWQAVNHALCKANICLWSTLSNSLSVWMSVWMYLFCLLCMYNMSMYICIRVLSTVGMGALTCCIIVLYLLYWIKKKKKKKKCTRLLTYHAKMIRILWIEYDLNCPLLDSSGAVWELRWTSWAVCPNEPSGFRGRKDLLNRASALVTTCP